MVGMSRKKAPLKIIAWFTWDARTSRHPRPEFLELLGSPPHLVGPYQWAALFNIVVESWTKFFPSFVLPEEICPHLRMVCWIYCWTARVESISSKGSSTHCEKFAVFVPDEMKCHEMSDLINENLNLVDFVWWSLCPRWPPPPSWWSSRSSTTSQENPEILWKGASCKNINVAAMQSPCM